MDSPSSIKTSALPRPLSKLPLPRSFAAPGPPKPPSPDLVGAPAPPATLQHHASKLSSGSLSTTSSHRSSSSLTSSSRPTTARKSSNESNSVLPPTRQRLPLHPPHRPQSKQGSNRSSQACFGDDHLAQAHAIAARHPSQQENALELWDSPEESDGSSNHTTSPVRTLKKPPRPSLSDRTVDSLAHMSPTVNKRRSSFFNSGSPMATPVRPTSASINTHSAVPKPTYGPTRREPGFAKPASPTKRPDSRSAAPITPSQRTFGSALPRSGLPTAGTPSNSHVRSKSAIKPLARPSSVAASNGPLSRVSADSKPASTASRNSMIAPRSTLYGPTASKPATQLQKPQLSSLTKPKRPVSSFEPLKRLDTTSSTLEPANSEQTDILKGSPSSSSALRAQIAQAKAAHRKMAAKANSLSQGIGSSSYDFVNSDDPFNQGAQQNQSLLALRIDAARRNGRLNIAALNLKQVPEEVLQMYSAASMEASSVAWNETVDVERFIAADNEISELADEIFPDAAIEELAQGIDATGNQFGGIDTLDLHGNLLTKMPMGLRRLERLTTLNLARNKLDNHIFEVIVQVPSLRELRLSDNELSRDIPENINQLAGLEVLDLHNNKLSVLPRTVRDLVKLRVLNLSNNRFSELPLGSLFSLPNLLEIYVATNALTGAFFPDTVDIVRSLQTLDVSNNSLAALSFASDLHLPALQYINVAMNRLFAFPNVSSWASLLNLLAEENGLTSLPAGFTSLKQLRIADFSRNSLRAIEVEVGKMNSLETLNVASNPLREKRFLTMTTHEIKEELSKRLEAPE